MRSAQTLERPTQTVRVPDRGQAHGRPPYRGPSGPSGSGPGRSGEQRVSPEMMTELYKLHHRALFKLALSLTFGDRQRAEDAVQEVFLRLWHHPEVLAGQYETIRPWLYTVTRRVVMDALRARACRPTEVSDACLEYRVCDEDDMENAVTAHEFRQALGTLTPTQRDVLVDLYYRGWSYAEIAERLSIPVGTVKSRSYYALRAMRAALTKRGLAGPGSWGAGTARRAAAGRGSPGAAC